MSKASKILAAVADGAIIAALADRQIRRTRRPEIKTDWWWSRTDVHTGYQPWKPDGPIKVNPGLTISGDTLWVRVAITNIGNAASPTTLQNLVAPASVGILRYDFASKTYEDPREGAENDRVGLAPERSVKYFAIERHWPAGLTWVQIYQLTVPADFSEDSFSLAVDVNDAGFDARGSRREPSCVEADTHSRFDIRQVKVALMPAE